jgi:hypothetical protein
MFVEALLWQTIRKKENQTRIKIETVTEIESGMTGPRSLIAGMGMLRDLFNARGISALV